MTQTPVPTPNRRTRRSLRAPQRPRYQTLRSGSVPKDRQQVVVAMRIAGYGPRAIEQLTRVGLRDIQKIWTQFQRELAQKEGADA